MSIVGKYITIIPNKLYFCSTDQWQNSQDQFFEFSIDEMFDYVPFHQDFGPLKISYVFKYITEVDKIMKDKQNQGKKFWHLTSTNPKKYINSIFLICAFQIVMNNKTADQSFKNFSQFDLIGFRDSISGKSLYECPVIQCLRGFEKAVKLGWFNLKTFDFDKYSKYEMIENGDINQIIKDKIYAFSSPAQKQKDRFGKKLNSVSRDCSIFIQLGISVVIHLNVHSQLCEALQKKGIKNQVLPINDHSCIDIQMAERFIELINKNGNKKIAVHCKSGLGKTGTMIACYAINIFKFKGPEIIGWVRLCRPGCIVGNQQHFLIRYSQFVNKSLNSESIKKNQETTKQRTQLSQINKRPLSSERRQKSLQIFSPFFKKKGSLVRRNSINAKLQEGKQQVEKIKKLQSLINKKYQHSLPTNFLKLCQ